jgi:DNA-binding XRE family transcriptional regulator
MPFEKLFVQEKINKRKRTSKEFEQLWEESREEYRLIGEMISIRKAEKITQTELAELTGSKQQVISRIEKKENSPSLRMFCNMLQALGYELQIVKRQC